MNHMPYLKHRVKTDFCDFIITNGSKKVSSSSNMQRKFWEEMTSVLNILQLCNSTP